MDGKEYVRGRCLLKSTPPPAAEVTDSDQPDPTENKGENLRRSTRTRRPPDRYDSKISHKSAASESTCAQTVYISEPPAQFAPQQK